MSEENRKPAKRWYKKRSNILALSLFLFVCAVIVLLCIMTAGNVPSVPKDAAYEVNKNELQTAVKAYQSKNDGELPTINGNVTLNALDCHIIDICTLLLSEGWTQGKFPDGCISINGSDNDNCDAGCGGCRNTSHYIWVLDSNGSVHSTCVGEGCKAYNQDGYQGVWP